MIKVFKTKQVKKLDAYTILNEPISSPDLMERASIRMVDWICDRYSTDYPFLCLIGPGNNGGDGLVIARLLKDRGYDVLSCLLKFSDHLSPDCQLNLERLKENDGNLIIIDDVNNFPQISENTIIVDAIFGAGLDRAIEKFPAKIINIVNKLPNLKISVDAPSGLFGEDNTFNNGAILKAGITMAIQFPNLSFFFAENIEFVGEWNVIDIGLHPYAIEKTETDFHVIETGDIVKMKKSRTKFSHKGTFGHALLIAGSYGKIGAAVLAAKSCLRSGVGLLTVHVPKIGYPIIQSQVPEAMLSIDQSEIIFTSAPDLNIYSAVGIGPGLGTKANTKKAVEKLLAIVKVPVVLDADALNVIANNLELLELLPENSIITPHPKEFQRLFGESQNNYISLGKQIEAAKKYKIIIIFKGANTRIVLPDGQVYFNSTGNPGMATAGSGDVLTGIILALLAQKYKPHEAAILGVWLHGRAGDIYADKFSEESLIAGDIISTIGVVFKELKK